MAASGVGVGASSVLLLLLLSLLLLLLLRKMEKAELQRKESVELHLSTKVWRAEVGAEPGV